MEMEARVSEQPAVNERRLMRGVVIQDKMDVKTRWHFGINAIQELAKLGRAVSPMQFADGLAGRHIQGGEQRRGAMAFVIEGAPLGLSGPHRQRRLGAVKCL